MLLSKVDKKSIGKNDFLHKLKPSILSVSLVVLASFSTHTFAQSQEASNINISIPNENAILASSAGANSYTTYNSSKNSNHTSSSASYAQNINISSDNELTLEMFNKLPKSRISKMRDAYLKAVAAFKRGDEQTGLYIQRTQLQGYPLNIWLDYYRLAYDVKVEKFEEVMQFINSGKHNELANLLRARYAAHLSRDRDYQRLARLIGPKMVDESKVTNLNFYQKTNLCRFYEANWGINAVGSEALSFATNLYLDLSSPPYSCQGLLRLMEDKGYLDDKLKLKRFEKVYIKSAATKATEELADELENGNYGARVKQLMALYDKPESLFTTLNPDGGEFVEKVGSGKNAKTNVLKLDELDTHRTAVLAFKRYANLSPRSAKGQFNKFKQIFKPSQTELIEIYQIFASGFLGRNYTQADIAWVDKNLPVLAWSNDLKEQRLRRAIYFSDWAKVYVLIDHLPKDIQNSINWRYWKGRSALELGKVDEADRILYEVAKDRSFFGFYAAQSLNQKYPLNYLKLSPSYAFPMDIANNKAALRFLELHTLEDENALYEWREIAKYSPEHEGMVMAQWALQTGNVKYAIDYVISSQKWDALDYRFPMAYRDEFELNAKEKNVPLSFLYGISRQESMLNPTIRSWAGAVGLMQVMPATAKHIAKKEKWQFAGVNSLTDPATNIRYGSTYISWMLERFDNNRILAAAAYNAGPNRIPQWKSKDGRYRDVAMFVETIPFNETRKYVQNVILYDNIYYYLLTGKETPLIKANELSYKY